MSHVDIWRTTLIEIVWWTVLAVLNNLITSFTELLYSHLSFMSISTLHFTPVTQTQRERSTVLTSTNERSSLLESSSLSILPSLSTLIIFCTVAASPLMASSLSSLQCSLHFLCFYIWYCLFFSVHPSPFYVSLNDFLPFPRRLGFISSTSPFGGALKEHKRENESKRKSHRQRKMC